MEKRYIKFTPEQLADDDGFIRWVSDGADPDKEPWRTLTAQSPQFNSTVEEARQIVTDLRGDAHVIHSDTKALWSRIESTIGREADAPVRRRPLWPKIAAAAAACFILVVLLTPFLDRGQSIQTASGERIEMTLPDASAVFLNAESSVRFKEATWEEARNVRLDGEAYFSVETGSTFTVETDMALVEVLGTEFNVYARDGDFEVECTEGTVSVTLTNGSDSQILVAGEFCNIENGTLVKKSITPLQVEWLENVFRFETAPLRRVFDEIERQYDVDVKAPKSVFSKNYTGSFGNDDLDAALYDVCWPMRLTYSIKGDNVVISEETED